VIQIKSKRELDKMREAGRHVGEILVQLAALAKPGVTTAELDRAARAEIRARRLESSFLGYAPGQAPPFPAVLCASVNEEIVHGIPGSRRLAEGDLVKLDFGAICDGFHGDAALSLAIGPVDDESRRLLAARRSRRASASSFLATDSATSAPRCRPASRAPASRSCATSSATASAAPCTSRRSSRTSESPAAASDCARAWCSRSSRW
jgi:methionine aminopeptidase